MSTKHYIELVTPGILFGDASTPTEVDNRDPNMVQLPLNTIGFRFFDRSEAIVDGEKLMSSPKNYSGWYYKGREMTLEQVKEEMPNARILISNMESNNYRRIVRFTNGQCYPLYEKDSVLK